MSVRLSQPFIQKKGRERERERERGETAAGLRTGNDALATLPTAAGAGSEATHEEAAGSVSRKKRKKSREGFREENKRFFELGLGWRGRKRRGERSVVRDG